MTTYEYDAAGQRIRVNAFDDKQSLTAAGGAPITGTGTRRTGTSSYDNAGRLVSETSPLGLVTAYEYDAAGNRTAKIEGATSGTLARRSEVRYDAADRVLEVKDALGTVTRTARDAVGNEVEVREASARLPSASRAMSTMPQPNDADDRRCRRRHHTTFDAVGNAIKQERGVGLPQARTETFTYNVATKSFKTNALGVPPPTPMTPLATASAPRWHPRPRSA